MICDRCPDVEMELTKLYEGSRLAAWFCPCCRSKMRTAEMIENDRERRAVDQGVTGLTRSESLIAKEPLSKEKLDLLRRYTKQREAEYVPPCEHVTNPWTA